MASHTDFEVDDTADDIQKRWMKTEQEIKEAEKQQREERGGWKPGGYSTGCYGHWLKFYNIFCHL